MAEHPLHDWRRHVDMYIMDDNSSSMQAVMNIIFVSAVTVNWH